MCKTENLQTQNSYQTRPRTLSLAICMRLTCRRRSFKCSSYRGKQLIMQESRCGSANLGLINSMKSLADQTHPVLEGCVFFPGYRDAPRQRRWPGLWFLPPSDQSIMRPASDELWSRSVCSCRASEAVQACCQLQRGAEESRAFSCCRLRFSETSHACLATAMLSSLQHDLHSSPTSCTAALSASELLQTDGWLTKSCLHISCCNSRREPRTG